MNIVHKGVGFKVFWNTNSLDIEQGNVNSFYLPLGGVHIPYSTSTYWGSIEGDINNQVDLIDKLNTKQDTLPTNGDGTKYLSDDGTYKEVSSGVDAYTKQETDVLLDDKADKNSISVVGYSNNYNDLDNLPNIPVVPTNISAFNNDVGYLTQHQDISGKVDKEIGKGLSTNDYINSDKEKVGKIITNGVGNKYLSDDGSYKEVSGGGGGGGVSESDVKGWISRNLAVNNIYGGGVVPPSASHSNSISIGINTRSNGKDSIQIGRSTQASTNSISVGLSARTTETNSVAIGMAASANNHFAISIGRDSQSQHSSVAIGYRAINNNSTHTNCVLLGSNTAVTSANQVQLGSSTTTTYAYGAVQDRSDARDKTDIRDIELGLDFINKLRPVEYKWDYREDYFRDIAPQREDFEDEETYIQVYEQARVDFFKNPVKDGSKTRVRYHTGLIAQEVKQVMDDLGVDFGGFQHHQEKGGLDVMSLGYNELIAVLIKAVQELSQEINTLKQSNS